MPETSEVDRWLHATLTGDASLSSLLPGGVWRRLADQNAPFPVCVFQFQGGADVATLPGERVMLSGVWLVKAITRDGLGDLPEIVRRVDDLLHLVHRREDITPLLSVVREAPFDMTETDQGVTYEHLGALYRIQAKQED